MIKKPTLLKYGNPVLLRGKTVVAGLEQLAVDGNGPIQPPTKKTKLSSTPINKQTDDVLNAIFPPRVWIEDNQMWRQQVSSDPCTRMDVIRLEEQLDAEVEQRQARDTGICPIRRELYAHCFDELIRQVTINCAERGLMLLRVREEFRKTIQAYEMLHKSTVTFGMTKSLQEVEEKAFLEKKISDLEREKRDLERQLNEEKARCEEIIKQENDRRQVDAKKHEEEIAFLQRTNQQLKAQLDGFIITN